MTIEFYKIIHFSWLIVPCKKYYCTPV
uniref:Uncharacterized protein n=1 Tax=Arundo donax TaxID=35708 RepID=A0A0A9AJ15_ARUDO